MSNIHSVYFRYTYCPRLVVLSTDSHDITANSIIYIQCDLIFMSCGSGDETTKLEGPRSSPPPPPPWFLCPMHVFLALPGCEGVESCVHQWERCGHWAHPGGPLLCVLCARPLHARYEAHRYRVARQWFVVNARPNSSCKCVHSVVQQNMYHFGHFVLLKSNQEYIIPWRVQQYGPVTIIQGESLVFAWDDFHSLHQVRGQGINLVSFPDQCLSHGV